MFGSEVNRISPEKAIETLKADGIVVSLSEVKVILEFMYEMAEIAVEQYLQNPVEIS